MDGRGARSRRLPLRRPAERRLTAAAAVAVMALSLSTLAVSAAQSPSPSPSLDRMLAEPPSADFVEDRESSGTPIGAFDLGTYVQSVGGADSSATAKALKDDGFVAGYGRSWTSQASNVGLVELVVAFAGGRGARTWLSTAESIARSSEFLNGAIRVEGIDPYFGVRYADPSAPSFAEVVSFVKGNDYFLVGFISATDNLGDSAATQSKRQHDFAAPATIGEAQWPENASRSPLFPLTADRPAFTVLVLGLVAAALAGLVTGAAVLRSIRRRPTPPAGGSSGGSTPSTHPT